MAEEDLPDVDGIFDSIDQSEDPLSHEDDEVNILFVGSTSQYDDLQNYMENFPHVNFKYAKDIDSAIDQLLEQIFAIVILDDSTEMDVVTVSRIVRVNHPLARVVIISNSRKSLFIADIINHGSADSFLPKPIDEEELTKVLEEQIAKHEINKMVTNFVSSPPKLSPANYLLLDPSLSYDEDEPVEFVGVMISHKSVPRYSNFFEELLAKDEVLFAGYLSGITMLGQEMMKSKQPLKEINFGGISVIFRFIGDTHISIFVRNLSKQNYVEAEEIIDETVDEIISVADHVLGTPDPIPDNIVDKIDDIVVKLQKENEKVQRKQDDQDLESSLDNQTALLYGTNHKEQKRIRSYLNDKVPYQLLATTEHDEANKLLQTTNVTVLLLDSALNQKDVQNPLDFADFAKDEIPYLQVIYRMRDRRASSPIIRALNSGAINVLISYNSPLKDLDNWIQESIKDALEIKNESSSTNNLDSSINQALVAKTMIRKDEEKYLVDDLPILDGMLISKDEEPIFKRFWEHGDHLDFDDDLMAGMVASLDSVGEEIFYGDNVIGGFELGNSNIMVKHREEYNFAFFIENLNKSNAKVINSALDDYTDRLYPIIENNPNEQLKSQVTKARFDTVANNIYSEFCEKFTDL